MFMTSSIEFISLLGRLLSPNRNVAMSDHSLRFGSVYLKRFERKRFPSLTFFIS